MNRAIFVVGIVLAGALVVTTAGAAEEKAVASVAGASSSKPSLEDFIRHPQFIAVKISPDGKRLAASVLIAEDTGGIVFIDRATRERTGDMRLRGRTIVNDFEWVNDERVLLSIAEKDGSLGLPFPTGEIYGTNYDGKKQEILVGVRAGDTGFTRIKSKQSQGFVAARLVDELVDDDDHVLVSVTKLGNSDGDYPTLERMNVYSGARTVVSRSPVLNARYVLDNESRVRFAQGNDTQANSKLFYRPDEDADWVLLNDQGASGKIVSALGFSADGSKAYLRAEEEKGADALYLFDVATRERKRLLQNPSVDPVDLAYTHDGKTPFGVFFMDGKPALTFLNGKVPEAMKLRGLLEAFPGEWVGFTSFTRDGNEAVFATVSDRNPARFYLLDASGKATFLMASRDWIDPAKMAESQPIQFKARDGLTVHGYLTVPNGSDGKNLPLIVLPHGGPHGVRDDWGFDSEVQLLAAHGYAVLQPNFRGSGGYGREFESIGYRQWGRAMQDDITDATKWAIAQGIADAKRICIYGASYGAYAAAMGIVREPDLYRCAVGYVGVYDLPTMYSNSGWYNSDTSQSYRERILGGDQKDLRDRSPANHADKIRTPIFIIAGRDDKIAPIAHSNKMRDALEDAGKSYEWMVGEREGHGFTREESRRELYTRMLVWFDKYIGSGAANSTGDTAGTR
jgi:dipeptidyl aminopeptidase/acylaminoacyl peptidase